MTTKLNDDILASTGNTAKEQEMFFAGVETGEANAKNNADVRAAPAAPVSTVEQDEQPARLTDGYWWPTTASQLKRVAAELIRAADAMGAADDDDEEADLILSVVPTGAICLDEDDPEGRNLHPVLAVSIADYADEGAYPVDPLDPTGGRLEEAPAAGDALADPVLQKLFGEAITGALGFGAQGVNPPPVGHWLEPFWNMARADASLAAVLALLDHPLLRDVLGYVEDAGPADVWGAAQSWMGLRDAAIAAQAGGKDGDH